MKKLIYILILVLSNYSYTNSNLDRNTFSANEELTNTYIAVDGDNDMNIATNTLAETLENKTIKDESDSGFDDFQIAAIVVLIASIFLMMQLERLIFDTEGEIFHQIVCLIIAAIFYFLFGLMIVRVLGVTDIILFATLISLTCFVIPIFRLYEKRAPILDDNIVEISESEILNDRKDFYQMSSDIKVQNVNENVLDDKSSIFQKESYHRFNRIDLEKEIISEIGYGSFERWHQLTRKMLLESKKSREKVLDEIISFGLKKEIAEKMIELFKK
jgi:hypothetical protein